MRVIGVTIWQMDKEPTLTQEVLSTSENGKMIYKMVMDLRNGLMAQNIKFNLVKHTGKL